jgi:cytochrome c oxidase subunit 2
MKMDAVPGTPTTMWLTPIYTTEEMKKMTNNADFEYELSCDQMCGRGHFTMRAVIKVVTPDEFILWRAKQKSNYAQVFPEPGAAVPDSSAKTTTLIKEAMPAKSVATKY